MYLVGVVCHEGRGINSGHYVAICRDALCPDDTWVLCNDTRISLVGEAAVAAAEAYLLVFAHRSVRQLVFGLDGVFLSFFPFFSFRRQVSAAIVSEPPQTAPLSETLATPSLSKVSVTNPPLEPAPKRRR